MASADPSRHNEQLVSALEESGVLRDAAVAAAFRSVLRHHFLPDRPLDEVYEDSAIPIKSGEHGLPISSSSQPAIMAVMLQLLELRPGQRVLEIGTGTGYNAALIARLAGPAGRVVSVDIDGDLVARARVNLERAGVTDVEAVAADGADGWPAGAPYDRIVVTAGADDLFRAWRDQLLDGGRLVLPLALAGPGQQCVALVRAGRTLTGGQLCPCGFMPLRGDAAPDSRPADDELARWLAESARAIGQVVGPAELRAGFELWLALADDGYARLAEPVGTFGLRDEHGAALVVERAGEHQVLVCGRDGGGAAARLARALDTWTRQRPALDRLRVAAYPSGEAPPAGEGRRTVRRTRFTFVVRSA